MKSLIIIFGCVLCMVAFAKCDNDKAAILEDLAKCGEESGVSDEDMEKIVAHKLPETKNGSCAMACFMKKHDMMTAENSMNVDGIKSFMKKVLPNHDELPEELISALDECNKEISAEKDECDAAKHILECVMPKIHEHMEKKLAE